MQGKYGVTIFLLAVCYEIAFSSSYFPLESTQEMLDEWRPLLCPFDMSMLEGVNLLAEFLPTTMRAGEHAQGVQLWFHEFVHLWLGNHCKVQWDEVSQESTFKEY